MRRNTYVKPNSYTQQKKVGLLEAVDSILELADISLERHNELIFELGCEYVETNAPQDKILLTDKEFGFWDWWFYIFIRDDQNIINAPLDAFFEYFEAKRALLDDGFVMSQFNEFCYGK